MTNKKTKMTNERAKEVLQEQIDRYGQEYDAEGIEALEIAIKVLEQQPCEKDVLKFYYVESLDDYWIGERLDTMYYAEWDFELQVFVWTHSKYLPWGEHVVAPNTLWKEHTYPSEPKEIPFEKWIKGFLKKHGREQQPCENIIRRADVLKYAQLVRDDEGIVHEMVHVDDIKDASSVTWSGWTPATQLPEPSTAVLLHVKYKSSGQWTYLLGMWNGIRKSWEDWRTPYQLEEEFEVIAWMELPEKYEEDNNE